MAWWGARWSGIAMPLMAWSMERGQAGQGQVRVGEGVLREGRGEHVRLWSLLKQWLLFYLISAHKLFDKMASRNFILNFAKIFHGCDANII